MSESNSRRTTSLVTPPTRIAIISPVFEDWQSYARLARDLDHLLAGREDLSIDLIAVDDGSPSGSQPELLQQHALPGICSVRVIELVCNLGHQRAIAVGLEVAVREQDYDAIVIMDADGEDRPEDAMRLIEEQQRQQLTALVASRSQRSEGPGFKLFYRLYKALYRLLTGGEITFGNFSILSRDAARRLVHMPELWNNFPSALLRSRLPHSELPTVRGHRYLGQSRMNLANLVIHGLSAISVNSDVIFARVMIMSAGVGVFALIAALLVTCIRLFTDLAIPGWTSDVVGNLAVIFLQTLFFFLLSMFLLLHSRSIPARTTAQVAPDYIASIREIDIASGD